MYCSSPPSSSVDGHKKEGDPRRGAALPDSRPGDSSPGWQRGLLLLLRDRGWPRRRPRPTVAGRGDWPGWFASSPSRSTVPAIAAWRPPAPSATGRPLDEFRVCYHDDCDRCSCRKPALGLLTSAARDRGIELAGSFMVGDRWRDVEAGRRAGCWTILVGAGYGEPEEVAPDERLDSIAHAADWILRVGDGTETATLDRSVVPSARPRPPC